MICYDTHLSHEVVMVDFFQVHIVHVGLFFLFCCIFFYSGVPFTDNAMGLSMLLSRALSLWQLVLLLACSKVATNN